MRDEIMRLADQMDEFVASRDKHDPLQHLPYWNGRHHERDQNADIIAGFSEKLRALARTDHVEDKLGMVPIKPGNWPEDSSHENGNYECKCCHCGATFYGHKRRVTCKVCASPAPDHSAGVGGMVSAAKAVIQRWDSPLWREQTSTAALINDLREAVNALAQPVTAGADGGK